MNRECKKCGKVLSALTKYQLNEKFKRHNADKHYNDTITRAGIYIITQDDIDNPLKRFGEMKIE